MENKKEIVTYKAFDKDLKCREFQFEVGKTYTHEGDVKICESGFHSCENPFDVLNYYDLLDSRFAKVSIAGSLDKKGDDSKLCSAEITIVAELKLPDFINSCISYLSNLLASSGNYAQLASSGDSAQLASSGDSAKLASSGDSAKLASSGYSAKLASSGYSAKLASSGDSAQLASSGNYAQLASSGNYAQLASSGDSAKLASSGDYAKLASSGDYAQLASSGDYAQLASSGDYAQLASSGDYAQLASSGDSGVILSCGFNSKAKIGNNGAIALTRWVESEKRYRISVAYEGESGIKADTWYRLDDSGNFVECE